MRKYWAIIFGGILILSIFAFIMYNSQVRAVTLGVGLQKNVATLQSSGFQKFVDQLPILPTIKIPKTKKLSDPYDLTIQLQLMKLKIHRDLPETTEWGYGGFSPGPTIEVESGQALRVHWKNELPAQHILPAAAGMDMSSNEPLPDVRNVTHLHGASVEQLSMTDPNNNNDGWPDVMTVPGQEQITIYPNQQTARMLLYHDHAVGTTGRNVAAGLIGLYAIHDDYERSLNLPSGPFEISLVFQARGLKADGSLYYSDNLSQEYYGNVVAMNGKLWPYLNVEPRKYRFRMVNVSNARGYDIKLLDEKDESPGPEFYQIGSDGGFMQKTAILNDPKDPKALRLKLAPAERADVIIDFSKYAGKTFILNNTNRDGKDGAIEVPQLMKIIVSDKVSAPDVSQLPLTMRPLEKLDPAAASLTRQMDLTSVDMGNGMQMQLLNGMAWHDPLTERVKLGSTEVWNLINTTGDMHPFHIHLVNFQVLDRTPIDPDEYLKDKKLVKTGPTQPPEDNEKGWKDVLRLEPGTMTRIIMKFNTYTGFYVYHCHILEHEDMDMMRPFEVYRP
jgi:spore coat protein A, manganese oxidase